MQLVSHALCLKNQRNTGVILGLLAPNFRRLNSVAATVFDVEQQLKTYYTSLKAAEAMLDETRDLQGSTDDLKQVLVFENCLFQNNSHGPDSPMIEDGVITSLDLTDVVLKSCIFQNNNYSQPKRGVHSHCVVPARRLLIASF